MDDEGKLGGDDTVWEKTLDPKVNRSSSPFQRLDSRKNSWTSKLGLSLFGAPGRLGDPNLGHDPKIDNRHPSLLKVETSVFSGRRGESISPSVVRTGRSSVVTVGTVGKGRRPGT